MTRLQIAEWLEKHSIVANVLGLPLLLLGFAAEWLGNVYHWIFKGEPQ